MARQLTVLEHGLFKQMYPKEFLNQKWSKPDRETTAPNVTKVIKRFNQMSFWVSNCNLHSDSSNFQNKVVSCIVCQPNLKPRVALVKRFVDIAMVSDLEIYFYLKQKYFYFRIA